MTDDQLNCLIASVMSILASLSIFLAIGWFFGAGWAFLAFAVTVTINSIRLNRR